MVSLLDVLPELVSPGGPIHARFPRPMESVGQNYGFMLYRTLVPPTFCNKTVHLNIQGLRDRGILFVGKVLLVFFSISGIDTFLGRRLGGSVVSASALGPEGRVLRQNT